MKLSDQEELALYAYLHEMFDADLLDSLSDAEMADLRERVARSAGFKFALLASAIAMLKTNARLAMERIAAAFEGHDDESGEGEG